MIENEHTLKRGEMLAAGGALGEGHFLLVLAFEVLAHERVHGRQADEQGRVILLVEGQGSQAHLEQRAYAVAVAALAVVLLGGLEEAGVIDAAVALQLTDLLGDDVELLQHLPQHLLAFLLIGLLLRGLLAAAGALTLLIRGAGDQGQGFQLFLAFGGAVAQVLVLVALEGVHLLELDVDQLLDEGTLVLVGPAVVDVLLTAALVTAALAKQLLELIVVDVLVAPWLVHGPLQRAAKAHSGRRKQEDEEPGTGSYVN